ncbi:unnamed protein product, partial [Meganyctiphanes norvegica]
KGVVRTMQTLQLKLPQIQQIMQEFEKQTEIMDMKEEMMNDVIDDAMGEEEDEEEGDAIVSQVLDELGLQMTEGMSELPSVGGTLSTGQTAKAPVAVADAADDDIQARLDNLRRE